MIKTYEEQVEEFAEWFLRNDPFLKGATKDILKKAFYFYDCPLTMGVRCSGFKRIYEPSNDTDMKPIRHNCFNCQNFIKNRCQINHYGKLWTECSEWLFRVEEEE